MKNIEKSVSRIKYEQQNQNIQHWGKQILLSFYAHATFIFTLLDLLNCKSDESSVHSSLTFNLCQDSIYI